jgi:hypothetical protein
VSEEYDPVEDIVLGVSVESTMSGGLLVHDSVDRDSRQQIDVRNGIPLKETDELPPIRLDEETKFGGRTGRTRIEGRGHEGILR